MKTAAEWIEELELERHPEGGWFRRVHESELKTDTNRPCMTSIYYLLEGDDFSALHRLQSEEQWHFYTGSPLTVHEISPDGKYAATTLKRGSFQYSVKPNNWFGATVDGPFALVGCTVVPGFDYAEFELADAATLRNQYPLRKELIDRLTR